MTARTIAPTMNNAPRTVVARVSKRCSGPGAKRRLAAASPEGRRDIPALPLLKEYDHQQQKADEHVDAGHHHTQHLGDYTLADQLFATISAKLSGSKPAPPTSDPSTSGCSESWATFPGLTLPP